MVDAEKSRADFEQLVAEGSGPGPADERPTAVITIRVRPVVHRALKDAAHFKRQSMNAFCASQLTAAALEALAGKYPAQPAPQ